MNSLVSLFNYGLFGTAIFYALITFITEGDTMHTSIPFIHFPFYPPLFSSSMLVFGMFGLILSAYLKDKKIVVLETVAAGASYDMIGSCILSFKPFLTTWILWMVPIFGLFLVTRKSFFRFLILRAVPYAAIFLFIHQLIFLPTEPILEIIWCGFFFYEFRGDSGGDVAPALFVWDYKKKGQPG